MSRLRKIVIVMNAVGWFFLLIWVYVLALDKLSEHFENDARLRAIANKCEALKGEKR